MVIIRWLLIAVATLVGLLAAAIIAVLLLVDTRQIQDIIAEQTEEAIGRELHFEGDLSLSFFPWLGFELGETRLANAEGFADDGPMAQIGTTELRVQVLPLLRRQVVLDTIVLRDLELNLGIDADGRSNWADIEERLVALAAEDEEPADIPDEERPDDDGLGELPFDLRVGGFELAAATLNWRDRESDTAVSIRDLNVTTGPLALGEETPVRLNVTLEPEGAPRIAVDATTQLRATLEPLAATLRDLTIDVEASGDDIPGGTIRTRLTADIAADLDAGTARIDPLRLSLAERVNGSGQVRADFAGDVPTFNGSLDFPRFSPRALARDLDIELPEMADAEALTALAFGFAFAGNPDRVEVEEFSAQLDASALTGQMTARLDQAVPRINARFDMDAIDVDRYLPDGDKRELGEIAEDAETGDDDDGTDPIADLPREAFHAVNADAVFRIGRVGYSGLNLTDMVVSLLLEDGLLTLRDSGGSVAGGRIGLAGRLDARGEEPSARFSTTIQRVQSEPLIEAFLARSPLVGQLDTTLELDTAGGSLGAWLSALNGDFTARFGEGAIRGLDINQTLRNASARMRNQAEEEPQERITPFSALSASGRIRDGVLTTRGFNLESEYLRGTGDGKVDIGRQEIDYTASFVVRRALLGGDVDPEGRLEGLTIPIRLTGSLFAPSVGIDLTSALEARLRQETDQVRERAREEADKARREAEEELRRERDRQREKIEDRVRDLFSR